MAGRSLAPSGPGPSGGGGDDGNRGRRPETIAEWARLAKVSPAELAKQGPEKVQENLHPGKPSQRMPDWVFDNDFEGQPPLNPTEELKRMDREMAGILADLERAIKRSPATSQRVASASISPEQISPDIANLLEENARRMQQEQQKAAGSLRPTKKEPSKDKEKEKEKEKDRDGKDADDAPGKS